MKNKKIKIKGQIFLMSLLILSAVLILGLILLTIFTKDLRQAIETPESVKAFYAADSCLEWQLYDTFKETTTSKPQMKNNSTCEDPYNTFTLDGSIKVVGVSKNVKRGIEVKF